MLNKDQLGNIILTKLSIEVNIILTEPTNEALVFKEKKFISQYVYKNNENKFESSQTIRIKKDDLINKITENILIFLRF